MNPILLYEQGYIPFLHYKTYCGISDQIAFLKSVKSVLSFTAIKLTVFTISIFIFLNMGVV